jgi:hypothetical protein
MMVQIDNESGGEMTDEWKQLFEVNIWLYRNLVCELLLPSGTYVQSFGSIAPAVTKRAMLTDDDAGCYVIA